MARAEAIRVLLQGSGKCGQGSSATDGSNTDVLTDSESSQELAGNGDGLFGCSECSDQFVTGRELQKHERTHDAGKKCNVCKRTLAPGSSMTTVCTMQRYFSN